MRLTAAANSSGSFGSGGSGVRSVSTLQNRQPRVHSLPATMNVAVPRDQQSLRFGQRASSQTVCSPCSAIAPCVLFSTVNCGPAGRLTRNQLGKRGRARLTASVLGAIELTDVATKVC